MDIETLITGRGASLLGVGGFSAVVSDPTNPGAAIKFGHSTSDGWPAWAKWTQENPSPWVPAVFSFQWITNTGGHRILYVAEIERLQAWTKGHEWLRGLLGNPDMRRHAQALAEAAIHHDTDLAVFLYRVSAAFPNGTLDLGTHNWMSRGDQLVLTDPLSYRAKVGDTKGITL